MSTATGRRFGLARACERFSQYRPPDTREPPAGPVAVPVISNGGTGVAGERGLQSRSDRSAVAFAPPPAVTRRKFGGDTMNLGAIMMIRVGIAGVFCLGLTTSAFAQQDPGVRGGLQNTA